jgi:hypothetical protein
VFVHNARNLAHQAETGKAVLNWRNASVTGANGLAGSARCADRTPQRGVPNSIVVVSALCADVEPQARRYTGILNKTVAAQTSRFRGARASSPAVFGVSPNTFPQCPGYTIS